MRILITLALATQLGAMSGDAPLQANQLPVTPVSVDGVSVYPMLYGVVYRSTLDREPQWWRFLGTEDACVRIEMEAANFASSLRLFSGSPEGSPVVSGPAPLMVPRLPTSDWYYIRAASDGDVAGRYTLSVRWCN